MVRTRLKLAATLTVVVLALTGFHTGHGSGGSGGGSGKSKSGKSRSDGGCSSDEKSNDDYSGSGGSGGSGGGTPYAPTPTAASTAGAVTAVVDCVDPAQKKRKGKPARKADITATVKVRSTAAMEKTFRIVVVFKGASGGVVDHVTTEVTVEPGGMKTVEVEMAHPENVGRVKECWSYDMGEEGAPASTATPSATSS
ncbi:hypothetical protein [Streptomyces exfoliatus]|uniref:hypothetical protein n=1 Tax=Streptomyces exfoliatus TaxID=1905 RepID=UPI003C2B3D89